MIARPLRTIPPLAALFALCAGGPTPVGAQASPQAARVYDCADLITEQEIDRVIGQSGTKRFVGSRGDPDPGVPGYSECNYELPRGVVLGVAVYTVEILGNIDVAWTRSLAEGAKAVSGIGESALLADVPGGRLILAHARGRGLRVNAGDMEETGKLDLNEVVKRVAAIVVARI